VVKAARIASPHGSATTENRRLRLRLPSGSQTVAFPAAEIAVAVLASFRLQPALVSSRHSPA
jgi:hypothetical protein